MNVAAVRRMTKSKKLPRRDDELLTLPVQRITQLCPFCEWRVEDVLVPEGSRRFRAHHHQHHGKRKWPA